MTEQTADKTAAPKEKFSWNPLVPIVDADHARKLAKDGGLACIGLLALGYVLMTVLVMFGGQSPYAAPGDTTFTQIGHGVALALAALLAWRIHVNQPLWALGVTLAWMVVETAGKVLAITAGGAGAASFVLNAIALVVGVQAVRGALWLRKSGRGAGEA